MSGRQLLSTIGLRTLVPKDGCITLLKQSISQNLKRRPDQLNRLMLLSLCVARSVFITSLHFALFSPFLLHFILNNSFKITTLIMV